MSVFRKGVYHAETNHVLEMMMLILNQFSSTILKIFSSSFVGLKSIVSLQLRATMTGLIKEVINRSSGHPQGGGSEMGGQGGAELKRTKIFENVKSVKKMSQSVKYVKSV